MPENGFSPRESAPRRLERSSSLMPRGAYPDSLSWPKVWGLAVTGRFLRLPAGVSRASTGFDRGSVVRGKEQLGRGLADERCGAQREPAEALSVEADDRLGDDAIAADAEKRRNVRHAEGVRGLPGVRVVGSCEAGPETVGEGSGFLRIILRNRHDREADGFAVFHGV